MRPRPQTLTIQSAPHLGSTLGVDVIMFNVVLALLPVCGFAIFTFGLPALLVLTVAIASCVVSEHLWCRFSRRPTTVSDGSVLITGILYGLVLPPSLPLWMVAAGGVIAVSIGKLLFGGLGQNVFNPALVGRAFLQAAFPAAMTHWSPPAETFSSIPRSTLALPLTTPHYDGVSAATPLAKWKFDQVSTDLSELALGSVPGSIGETSALLILLGGVYLVARRMMSWEIPVAILSTVALASGGLQLIDPQRYAGPAVMLFSGGLMLGAVFMATDMVASPITRRGRIVYGTLIGTLVVVIRVWGGMPEGVMYAILLGNACSPHLDHWIQPQVFGTVTRGDQS